MTLKIRHKVLLPALAVIVVLLALAAYSTYSISLINRQSLALTDLHLPGTIDTRDMRPLLDDIVRNGRVARVSNPPAEFIEKYAKAGQEFDATLDRLIRREPVGVQPVQARLKDAVASLRDVLDTQDAGDVALIESRIEDAYSRLHDLEEHYARRVERGVTEVAQIGRVAARSTFYALVVGLLVSIIVWVLILLSLSRPLRELVSGTERIAQGHFSDPIPVLSKDELGTLSGAFNRMATSLSELDRMKAEFVATASHELKTPLACIKGFASLLRSGAKGPLTEEQKTTLAQVDEQVDQMTNFVSQLLDLSRLRAGRVAMNFRSLPTEAFFGSVARGFEGVAERRAIHFEVNLAAGLPPRIQVDPDRMREVVYNLLANAFKFTPAGGRVIFEAGEESGSIRVRVSDTGPGIPQQDLPFIFEKYFKGMEGAEPAGNEGAGLGLAISRGIVERHGGRIWVESVEGQGARFVFRVPVTASAGEESTQAQAGAPESRES